MTVRVLLVLAICFASACGGPTEPASQPDQPQVDKVAIDQPAARVADTAEEDEVAPPLPPVEPSGPTKVLAKHADEQRPGTQPGRPAGLAKAGISVAKQPNGEPVLSINCPWRKYQRPSIQISLVLDDKVDLSSLQPLRLDGAMAESLWKRQVESLNKPTHAASRELVKTTTAFIEYNDRKLLKHRARENSLGRASAYAIEEQLGTLLVFYRLAPWIDDRGTFRLTLADIDLPSKFASPGRIRVWLLGEEKVVWSADAIWPGKQPADRRPAVRKTPEPQSVKPKPAATPQQVKPKATEPKAKQPVAAPKPAVPKAAPKTDGKKSATKDIPPKTWVKSSETGPALSSADSKPSLPATVKRPAPVESKPKKPVDINKLTIDELASHIERTWGSTMSKSVRKSWVGGWNNYYQVENPFTVRRAVFMSLVKACHVEQPPGKLRDAFAALYFKLKQLSQEPRKN